MDFYVGVTSRPRHGPGIILVGLLSSDTPGRSIHRSRGVIPSSVAPECLGDSKSRTGDCVHPCVVCMRGTTADRWQSRAMTKPVSRDAKMKGPKESTGRALVNCASGKYHSSPIKL